MKQLYTFFWTDSGKEYEPLQASSEKQALWHLINRLQRDNARFDKFPILRGFRNGTLRYKIRTPYKPAPKPKPEPPKPEGHEQLPLFKDYLKK